MANKQKKKFLGLPTIIWKLQLLYVAVALIIYLVMVYFLILIPIHSLNKTIFNISYVLVIIIVNIIWRVILLKKYPKLF
ncbi:MAG: hypothetical protein NTV39_01865 [Candidatus Saccharibacteria bacterium]|nr:hypothetical protein [Candidatus Saccharibacteria bacterium]